MSRSRFRSAPRPVHIATWTTSAMLAVAGVLLWVLLGTDLAWWLGVLMTVPLCLLTLYGFERKGRNGRHFDNRGSGAWAPP